MDKNLLMSYIFVNTINKRFEWDIYKAIANVSKHGIGFRQAAFVFSDPDIYIRELPHGNEKRFQVIGQSPLSDVQTITLSVIVTFRHHDTSIRIMSARRANRLERIWYERKN